MTMETFDHLFNPICSTAIVVAIVYKLSEGMTLGTYVFNQTIDRKAQPFMFWYVTAFLGVTLLIGTVLSIRFIGQALSYFSN